MIKITIQKVEIGDVCFFDITYPVIKIGGLSYTLYKGSLRMVDSMTQIVKYRLSVSNPQTSMDKENLKNLIEHEIKPSFPKEVQQYIEVISLPDEKMHV